MVGAPRKLPAPPSALYLSSMGVAKAAADISKDATAPATAARSLRCVCMGFPEADLPDVWVAAFARRRIVAPPRTIAAIACRYHLMREPAWRQCSMPEQEPWSPPAIGIGYGWSGV